MWCFTSFLGIVAVIWGLLGVIQGDMDVPVGGMKDASSMKNISGTGARVMGAIFLLIGVAIIVVSLTVLR
jgi:hypothetical protein